jgi:ATP-dependent Clp endopeptidase proteolytic subunit ClpP
MFAAATKNGELELLIYDSIGQSMWGGGGVTAESVKQKLDEAGDVSKISVRINSPGGDVFEGAAIYSLLSQHKAPVECFVDGLAASAAFTIAMAANTVHVSESAMMMCHNAWGMCMGYAADMEKMAETLGKVSGTMRDIYAKRCGMKADEVQKLMDAETWMTAEEAVEYGFADDVIERDAEAEGEAKALAASYDLSKFKRSPRAEKDTKRVGGKDCTKSCFAYRPDDDHENWKLPIECPDHDAEWEKKHIRNAISRWSSTDMPNAAEKSKARGRIKAAAKKYGIEVDDDSLKGEADQPDEGDACACACAGCRDGYCGKCSNEACNDSNCKGCKNQEDVEPARRAKALAEVESAREQFAVLSI